MFLIVTVLTPAPDVFVIGGLAPQIEAEVQKRIVEATKARQPDLPPGMRYAVQWATRTRFSDTFGLFARVWLRQTIAALAPDASGRLIGRYAFMLDTVDIYPIRAAIAKGSAPADPDDAPLWQACAAAFWASYTPSPPSLDTAVLFACGRDTPHQEDEDDAVL